MSTKRLRKIDEEILELEEERDAILRNTRVEQIAELEDCGFRPLANRILNKYASIGTTYRSWCYWSDKQKLLGLEAAKGLCVRKGVSPGIAYEIVEEFESVELE